MLNTEYILPSIKSQLGIDPDFDAFDGQLITDINSVFMLLKRMGVGPETGFTINSDENSMWTDFMPEGTSLEAVKTYVYMKVKLMFDPPTSSSHMEALKENIREFEWSLNFEEDCLKESEEGEIQNE